MNKFLLALAVAFAFVAPWQAHAQGAVDVPTMEQHNALESRVEALELLHAPPPVPGANTLSCATESLTYPAGQLPSSFTLTLNCTKTTDEEPETVATTTHAVSLGNTINGTSFGSGPFTPAADDLLYVTVAAALTTVAAPTLTSSVAGKTFTLIESATYDGSTNTLYVFVADQLASEEEQSVTFDCTGDVAGGTVINVERVSGVTKTGLDAILQVAIQENAVATADPETTFAVAAQTGNPTITAVAQEDNAADPTEPTGWTALGAANHGTPAHSSETAGRDSGFTGTVITWGSAFAAPGATISVEIDTSAAGGGAARPPGGGGLHQIESGGVGIIGGIQDLGTGFI